MCGWGKADVCECTGIHRKGVESLVSQYLLYIHGHPFSYYGGNYID